jgi:hypothetical protein
MEKTNLFSKTLPFNPWAMHLRAFHKLQENAISAYLETLIIPNAFKIGIRCVWSC